MPSLIDLGMRPFFQQQLTLDELEKSQLGRVVEQHKSQLVLLAGGESLKIALNPQCEPVCVGDWVVFQEERLVRVLARQSLFQRKAAGTANTRQLIAANIDCLFIVSSLNDDFNLNRIERYLALAKEAGVEPVVILTKMDLCQDAEIKRQQVQALDVFLQVYCFNALKQEDIAQLIPYCRRGQTLAFMGSSGVGKSTLINGLLGTDAMETGTIREQDSKGRHTTTYRAIHHLPTGGLLMDTPGMRALQLNDNETGIKRTFADIDALASQCRFKDCQHINEPGCKVLEAINTEELSKRRLDNYQKLLRENAHNSATLSQKRAKDKAFTKMVNRVQTSARDIKKFS